MGGKNYPKKGSKGSGQTGPSSGGQAQPGQPSNQRRLPDTTVRPSTSSGQQVQSGQQTQPKPQQQQPSAWNLQAQSQGPTQSQGSTQSQGQAQRQPKGQQKPAQQSDSGAIPKTQWRAESSQSLQSAGTSGGSQSSSAKSETQKPSEQSLVPTQADKSAGNLYVKYKGVGTSGSKLGLIQTNYLKLITNNMANYVYHYDVTIEPDRPKKLLQKVFMKFNEINFSHTLLPFDGKKNAYSPKRIKIGDFQREITIIHPETGAERKFIVSIKEANECEIPFKSVFEQYVNKRQKDDPKRALQALEVILKAAFHQQHLSRGIQGGRSFFIPDVKPQYLGDYCELMLGLFQSVVLGKVPFLNVDVNHKAFPKHYNSLIELLRDFERDENRKRDNNRRQQSGPPFKIDFTKPLQEFIQEKLQQHLAGLEICYTNPGTTNKRIYKFMSIVPNPANVRFTLDDGKQINVLEYFQKSGRRIQYPAMPCIKLGNTIKNQAVPMEFCSIYSTQVINKKTTEDQTRNIIRFAATSTDERKRKITNLINTIKHNQSKAIQGFGLSIDTNFTELYARQLKAPVIQYGHGKQIEPSKGAWRAEKIHFLIPPENFCKWGILNTNGRTDRNQLIEFGKMLVNMSRTCGLQLEDQPRYFQMISVRDQRDQRNILTVRKEIESVGQKKEIDILFCIITDDGRNCYAKIKKMAELEVKDGVLTQCIKGNTVYKKRNDLSTISNILHKVNAKLNGTNHKVTSPILSGKNVMVIGADVTHPSPDQKKIPSVVGVAASHDEHAFCYNNCWRLQDPKKEIIQDFNAIMKEHLQFYRNQNKGALPQKIFYYRDGVAEGQFDEVMTTERNAMLQACREISPGYEKTVKMTIFVVQKRHHTRFFPDKNSSGGDRNNNVPPGTIVDDVITRPNENYFFLVSHQAIQGVAKPTKYCILLDDGDHNINDLQILTFNLCHLFSRCDRSVSYPAPTYYAHLVAERGRKYIEDENLDMDDLPREWARLIRNMNIHKKNPMHMV